MPEELELPEDVARLVAGTSAPAATAAGRADAPSLRYEVMYFLAAPDELIPPFKEVWAGIGDSIVVVGGDGVWNCHIHTDDVGAAIEAALDAGRPCEIRVTDLAEQVEEERWVREAARRTVATAPPQRQRPGDRGRRRRDRRRDPPHLLLARRELARRRRPVDEPLDPDILDVVESTPAEEVVVLPNNSNIFPVAQQAAEITSKKVFVVPTPGVQEGFAALLEYDPRRRARTTRA